jgi:dienelactone hydrolase
MAEVLLFHHVQGLTPGVVHFADKLRAAGHTVHTPDLFDGRVFESIDDGAAYADSIGFGTIIERGAEVAAALPDGLVYGGFSMGVLPAQMLAQTRPGASGALLYHSCIPTAEFGGEWPASVPVQIHGMDGDPFFAGEGDIDVARALVESVLKNGGAPAELFVYPGNEHLFADDSMASYDPAAADLLTERTLEFLTELG